MSIETMPPAQGFDVSEVRALLNRLSARRWWIIASIALFTTVLTAFAFLKTPVYRASTVLIPAGTGSDGDMKAMLGQVSGLAALAGINVGAKDDSTDEALAVLRSRQFTEAFINAENLMPQLFPRQWDSSTKGWKAGLEHPPTMAEAYFYFDRKVRTIEQDKKSSLLTVQINWKDRELAAQWANQLVARLNTEMRTRATASANLSISFLQNELDSTNVVAVRDAVSRLLESQIKKRMFANVSRDYAFRVVDPAVAPDEDDPVAPNKPLLIAAGPIAGLAFGAVLVLFLDFLAKLRAVPGGLR